ncbi:unnamed protein product, partial [Ascophyllum nodosum]
AKEGRESTFSYPRSWDIVIDPSLSLAYQVARRQDRP